MLGQPGTLHGRATLLAIPHLGKQKGGALTVHVMHSESTPRGPGSRYYVLTISIVCCVPQSGHTIVM